jgi:hypothetical protein
VNGPWLLGYGAVAQNSVPAVTRTGVQSEGVTRSLPFAGPLWAPRAASEQLLDRLELEEEQPVANEGQAPTCLRASSTSSASTMRYTPGRSLSR